MTKNAVIYARYSSDRQREESPDPGVQGLRRRKRL